MKVSIVLEALTGSFVTDTDRASKRFRSQMKEVERSAKIAGAAVGSALAAGIGIYIKNTLEAEKVQAQLKARLKDTAEQAKRTLKDLNAEADRLQKLTIFDDESIGEAQAAMLTFKSVTGEVFDRAIEGATDLATVLDTGVPEAAKLLGKALSDPEAGLGALRKAGVVLTEDQKKLVKQFQETGQIAEAQGVILDSLAGTMGTAAEAARDTLSGALKALGNSFNELLEGNADDNGMRGARDAIEALNNELNDPALKAGIDDIAKGIAWIGKVAAETIGGLHSLKVQILDTFSANEDKTMLGVLQRKEDVEARLKRLQDGEKHAGLNRALLTASAVGVGPDIAQLQGELLGLNAILKQRQDMARIAASTPKFPGWIDPPSAGAPKPGKDPNAAAAGKRLATDLAKAQEDAARDLAAAYGDLNGVLEDQARQLGGPALEAAYGYKDALEAIQKSEDELGRLGKLDADAQAQIATARDQAAAGYQRELEKIEAIKSPLQELLEQHQHELDLLGLTGPALRTAQELYGASATDIAMYGDSIRAANEALEAMHEQIERLDQVRNASEDFWTSIADGSASGIDALKNFGEAFAQMLNRMAADYLTSALFGERGTSGGGVLGGVVNSVLGMFGGFGGGASTGGSLAATLDPNYSNWHFASGTDNAPGGLAWVGEQGPELVNLPRGSQVIPHGESMAMAGGFTQVINQSYFAPIDPRTRSQIAQDVGTAAKRASARNGRR